MDKDPTLVKLEDFDLPTLGRTFDVALAISLFTHLDLNRIVRCLVNIDRVLAPDGPSFATCMDNDPYHYGLEAFRWVCEGTGLKVENLGDWGHPRGQRMLAFRHRPD